MISKVQWTKERQDRPIWVEDNKHKYTFRSGYNEGTMHTCEVLIILGLP